MFLFSFLFIFKDSWRTSYLKIYRTGVHQIFRVGYIDGRFDLKLVFRCLKGRCHDNQILSVLVQLVAQPGGLTLDIALRFVTSWNGGGRRR